MRFDAGGLNPPDGGPVNAGVGTCTGVGFCHPPEPGCLGAGVVGTGGGRLTAGGNARWPARFTYSAHIRPNTAGASSGSPDPVPVCTARHSDRVQPTNIVGDTPASSGNCCAAARARAGREMTSAGPEPDRWRCREGSGPTTPPVEPGADAPIARTPPPAGSRRARRGAGLVGRRRRASRTRGPRTGDRCRRLQPRRLG